MDELLEITYKMPLIGPVTLYYPLSPESTLPSCSILNGKVSGLCFSRLWTAHDRLQFSIHAGDAG